ncbi:MAG: DsbA family protein [Anaerolineales bacterium]|nr:DsbA family protein [Anaerolineales bacterium]
MPSRSEIREKRNRERNRSRIFAVLVVVGVGLVVAAILIVPNLRPVGEVVVPAASPRPNPQGTAMGDPGAPVVIEEYSDFQCAYCARFSAETEPRIVADYIATGKAYFVYKNYAFLGGPSADAAEASLCAADQGKFWEYHDILFANQNEGDPRAFSEAHLEAFAEAIGLDSTEFGACLSDNRQMDQVRQEYADGSALGVNSTPTFFVNGKQVSGAQPFEVFQAEIEAALAGG